MPPSTPSLPTDASVLPAPVCPQGVVSANGVGFEDPPGPGESALDDLLDRIPDLDPRIDLDRIPDLAIDDQDDADPEGGVS